MADVSGLTTNFFARASEGYSDNLSGSVTAGASTVPVNDASDWSTGEVAVLVVDPGTSDEAVFIGQKDTGNQFINCIWTEGNLAADHDSGATVSDYVAATTFDAMSKGIQQFLNQSGKMKNTAVTESGRIVSYFAPPGMLAPYAGSSAPSGWLLCDGSAVSRTTYADLFSAISTTYGSGNGTTTFNVPDLRGRNPYGAGQRSWALTVASTDVNTGNDQITITANKNVFNGKAVVLTTSGSAPAGLTAGSTYYVIVVDSTHIKLASSLSNAIAGTGIDITTQGSGNHTLTYTGTSHTLGETGGEENHATVIAEMPAHTHSVLGSTSTAGGSGALVNTLSGSTTTGGTGGSTEHNVLNPYLAVNYIIKT